jgi:hypothetical protein
MFSNRSYTIGAYGGVCRRKRFPDDDMPAGPSATVAQHCHTKVRACGAERRNNMLPRPSGLYMLARTVDDIMCMM